MKKKKVLVFGSTGSVGRSVLDLIEANQDFFQVIGLCSNRNLEVLTEQIKKFKPKYVCLRDQNSARQLNSEIKNQVKLFEGEVGLGRFSKIKSDISVMAISKIDCLRPLLVNIAYSKRIALANKEAVVAAAKFIFAKAKKHKTEIIPVDSEINAIFQLINQNNLKREDIDKVYLTASGGALIDYDKKSLSEVSVGQVLDHPTWEMGKRITVDSATLVNKGFEVVEAHEFFGVDYDKINILLHRQSLMHAMLKLKDKTCFSCIYPPTMKNPIAFSLFYPKRIDLSSDKEEDETRELSYSPICYQKFPLLKVIIEAAKRKDNSLIILNAADEVLVDYFLSQKIKFDCIEKVMKRIFETYPSCKVNLIKDVYFWDNWARIKVKEELGGELFLQ